LKTNIPNASKIGKLIGKGRIAEVFEWDEGLAVKLFYKSRLTKFIAHEASVSQLVNEAGFPSPYVRELVEMQGRSGIVFERLSGKTMLAAMSEKPWTLVNSANMLAELHSSMHKMTIPSLPDQSETMITGLQRIKTISSKERKKIIDIVHSLPIKNSLCHGDYHPDNVLLTDKGPFVIDWTTASTGNPIADVARTSLLLKLGELPRGTPLTARIIAQFGRNLFHRQYLKRYFQLSPNHFEQLAQWQLPIAAARMYDGIEEEQNQLREIVSKLLGDQKQLA